MDALALDDRIKIYSGSSENEVLSAFSEDLNVLEERMIRIGFEYDKILAVRICLDELFTNAHIHGNKKNPHLAIIVNYQISSDLFEGSVKDQGKGFDPSVIPDSTKDENLEKTTGRGDTYG